MCAGAFAKHSENDYVAVDASIIASNIWPSIGLSLHKQSECVQYRNSVQYHTHSLSFRFIVSEDAKSVAVSFLLVPCNQHE